MLSVRSWLRSIGGVVLLASACTQSNPGREGWLPAEKIPVAVYFQGPLTGRYSYLAIHAFQAARLRFAELNIKEDFPAEVTLKRANVLHEYAAVVVPETVVDDPATVAVIGPSLSGESEDSGTSYNDARIPFITATATSPDLAENDWDYWYRTVANDDDQGRPVGERMAERFDTIYVAHDGGGYGEGLAERVTRVAADNGVDVLAVRSIEPTRDFSSLIVDVQGSRAEALFYGGYDVQTGMLIAQARDAGLNIPIWSGDSSLSHLLLERAGNAATNVVLSCPCNLEGSREFMERYESEYGQTAIPLHAAEGYDAASLIGEGIRSAIEGGATEPTAIREGIKDFLDSLTIERPFHGVAKAIAFDPETHELATQDRRSLIFFYAVEPGTIRLKGSAADLLGAA